MNGTQGVGVLTTDRELRVRSWNSWLAAATGLSEGQVAGRPLDDVTGGRDTAWYRELFEEVLGTGTPRVLAPAFHRYLIRCAPQEPVDGFEAMQQRVTVAPLRQQDGIAGLIVTVEDVTRRIAAERQLAAELRERGTVSTSGLVASIGAADWQTRRAAVDRLGRTASVEDIELLLRALERDHHDINVLSSALDVLVSVDLDVTPALIDLLRRPDPNLRMHAALALGRLRADAAVPALITALDDADQNVRFHAIEALGSLRADEAVDALARVAESGDFFLSFAAIDTLSKLDDASVAPRLVRMLGNEPVRAAVLDTLAVLGDEDCVAPLVDVLNAVPSAAARVATALVRIHRRYEDGFEAGAHIEDLVRRSIAPSGVVALRLAVDRPQPPRPVVLVLGWVGRDSLPALLPLLGETSLQASVSDAIARIGRDAIEPLIGRLGDGTRDERIAAATLLGRLAASEAVAPLMALLRSHDPDVVVTAAGALSSIGDPTPLEQLVELFGDERAAVRRAAIAAVNCLPPGVVQPRVRDRLSHEQARVRESAIRVAGYFGFEDCADAIVAAAERDSDEAVRRAAIEQLPQLPHRAAVDALIDAVANDRPRNRAAAAHALGQCDDDATEAPLVRALDDDDPWVRYFAASAIARRELLAGVPALVARARDDAAPQVRIAALRALGALEAPHLLDVAGGLIEHQDDDLASAAVTALGAVSDPRVDPLLDRAVRTPRIATQVAAAQALAARGRAGAADVLAWAARVGEPAELREVAVDALRQLASSSRVGTRESAVAALLALAAERHHRDEALAALAMLPADAVDHVAAALDDERVAVRIAAVEALARMRNRQASDELVRALRDDDPVVRAAAVAAFGRVGSPAAGPTIASMATSDPDPAVRRRAEHVSRRHAWRVEEPGA